MIYENVTSIAAAEQNSTFIRQESIEKIKVRRGKYCRGRMPAEIEKLLLECEIPEWYVESTKKILYLFPKTHLIGLLKRDICKEK